MNNENIPFNVRHLIPLVEKWGIEDDGYRDELVFNSNNDELTELVNSIGDNEANALNDWFCDPELVKKLSDEYIKFSVFFMAFEYAKSILESRTT
ncbi:MAG TPA: hypothetical protein VIM75_04835 [Ohtaekwangia sp.]|uniref:hypothetical protein n=1 Tax=Ohtaekwangia sp. TaxID=2066019 RepID=UPI002F93BB10